MNVRLGVDGCAVPAGHTHALIVEPVREARKVNCEPVASDKPNPLPAPPDGTEYPGNL